MLRSILQIKNMRMECSYKYGSKFVNIFFSTSKVGGDRKRLKAWI